MCWKENLSSLPRFEEQALSLPRKTDLNEPAVHIRSIGLLRWPWLFGEECSWEGKFLMCELRERMWCDCASFLLITCSQSAVWAACRNYWAKSPSLCMFKTILFSYEPETHVSKGECLPCMLLPCWMKWEWISFCLVITLYLFFRKYLSWHRCLFHPFLVKNTVLVGSQINNVFFATVCFSLTL